VRKLIGISAIGLGAFFVIWFFMGVAYLIMDPRKRGPIEICLTIVFSDIGAGARSVWFQTVRQMISPVISATGPKRLFPTRPGEVPIRPMPALAEAAG
jgi:hypothetical protein